MVQMAETTSSHLSKIDDEQERRTRLGQILQSTARTRYTCGRKWIWAHRCLVAGSIIGNVIGTVAAISQSIGNPLLLGLLVSLPTMAFAVDKGFSIGATADWYSYAVSKYQSLADEFSVGLMSVEDALRRKEKIDSEIEPIKPKLQAQPFQDIRLSANARH